MSAQRFKKVAVKNLWWIAALALLVDATNARALCVYHGVLYAHTTLEQEFRDAGVVIVGTVRSGKDIFVSDAEADRKPGVGPGILDRVAVEQALKGRIPPVINYFSELDSGGYYPDAGTKYLLFLNRIRSNDWAQKFAPGGFRVNYNCGQSRPWAKVSDADRRELLKLSLSTHQSRFR